MNIHFPNRGLPLTRQRSAVFSPRRERAVLPHLSAPADLAAAVALVLSKYHGFYTVPLGLGAAAPAPAEVEVREGETLGEFRARVAAAFGESAGTQPPGDGSRNPDFDVAVLSSPPEADHREDVVLYPAAEGCEALWRARLLDAPTVERFLGHVRAVLTAPDEQALEKVYLLSPDEEEMLRGFEAGGAPVGSGDPVHVQVVEQARRAPASPALWIDCRTVTYAELESRSAVVARALVERGVRAGDSVALCVAAAAGVPALLGVLRAGAAVVPLDATFPRARLRSQLEQADVGVAVIDSSTRDAVPFDEVLTLDDLRWDASPSEPAPDVTVSAESPAYVLFTSGSTGVPKGIRMPHRGLSNVVGWQTARSAPAPRTLQRTSLAFDVGMQEVFSTLCAGGCLVLADEETRADPSRLAGFIARHEIERAFLPPVSLHQMAASLDAHPRPLPSLKEVYVAGEALKIDATVVRMFRSVETVLENQYGPTETHVATTFRLDDSPLRWPTRPPIGRPVPGLEVRILDERGRRVPLGAAGEIIVRGRQVAHGYVLGVPFVAEDGTPAYATGDLGRWTAAGELEFLGRRDRQVKVRGYRIELGEVETALQAQPGVRAAVVAAIDDAGNARLAAWVVPEGVFPGLGAVRKRLLDVLPEHMVPALSALTTVEELPLTRTGKVDVSALPRPSGGEAELRASYVPSRNEVESVVAEVWRSALGLEHVGVHDDFLEIGGHSLLAIRIVSQLNERFSVSLPLRLLLRGGTVATIAKRLMDLSAIESSDGELVECPLPDGRVVHAPFAGEAQYLWKDVFEENTYGPPVTYAEDALVVDVGANIGLYTLYALAAAPRGRVVAIEPVPVLFEALKRNTAEQSGRVAYFNAAAGEADGSAPLTYYPRLSGMSSLRADQEADGRLLRRIVRNLLERRAAADGLLRELDEMVSERLESQTLPCTIRRIEGILDEAAPGPIDVLKVDVQRYEEPVLRGVGGAWPRVRQVVVEVHDEGGALRRIEDFLRGQGFSTSTRQHSIHADTAVHFVVGRK